MSTISPHRSPEERAAQLKATIDEAVETLCQQLAEGHTEAYEQFLRFWSHFHTYSHGNVILIMRQRPDATQVAGYRTWQRLGRQVARGAKAIQIWCPILQQVENPETQEVAELCTGFVPCPVFAAEDLVDIAVNPLPRFFRELPDDAEDLWDDLTAKVSQAGIRLEFLPLRPGVQGACGPDQLIVLRPGLDSRNRIFVLLHELAHLVEHFRDERRDAPKDQRELEAESAAMIVASMLGLEHPTARDYILMYRGDADGLRASLAAIRRIVGQLIRILALVPVTPRAAPKAA